MIHSQFQHIEYTKKKEHKIYSIFTGWEQTKMNGTVSDINFRTQRPVWLRWKDCECIYLWYDFSI